MGLFAYSNGRAALNTNQALQAIANGLLIGQVYFWMQSTSQKRLQVVVGLLSAIFYLVAHQAVLPYVWFWVLLLVRVMAAALVLSRVPPAMVRVPLPMAVALLIAKVPALRIVVLV